MFNNIFITLRTSIVSFHPGCLLVTDADQRFRTLWYNNHIGAANHMKRMSCQFRCCTRYDMFQQRIWRHKSRYWDKKLTASRVSVAQHNIQQRTDSFGWIGLPSITNGSYNSGLSSLVTYVSERMSNHCANSQQPPEQPPLLHLGWIPEHPTHSNVSSRKYEWPPHTWNVDSRSISLNSNKVSCSPLQTVFSSLDLHHPLGVNEESSFADAFASAACSHSSEWPGRSTGTRTCGASTNTGSNNLSRWNM